MRGHCPESSCVTTVAGAPRPCSRDEWLELELDVNWEVAVTSDEGDDSG